MGMNKRLMDIMARAIAEPRRIERDFDKHLARTVDLDAPGVNDEYRSYLLKPDVRSKANKYEDGQHLMETWALVAGTAATPDALVKALKNMDPVDRELVEKIQTEFQLN